MAIAKAITKSTKAKKTTSKFKAKQFRIKRTNPDNIRSAPVNDVLINHSINEFFITFSSVEPPAILDEEDFKNVNSIEAIARSKITVSPQFIELMIKALTTNLESYKKQEKE